MLNINKNLEDQLRQMVDFVKEILAEEPDHIELEQGEDVDPLLLDIDPDELEFIPIDPEAEVEKVAAVDGGSSIIADGLSFQIGMYRAGYLIFQGDKLAEEHLPPPTVLSITDDNFKTLYAEAYYELTGQEPKRFPKASRLIGELRSLQEWFLTEKLVDKMGPGDIVLTDGSLRVSTSAPSSALQRITSSAAAKGVHIVAITKQSTLRWGKRSPLIPRISQLGDERYPSSSWLCRISDLHRDIKDRTWYSVIYVAKLCSGAPFGFRIDINREDDTDPSIIMSKLARYSKDPVYLGYPYPLAAIHNFVRLTPTEIEDIRYRLQSLALERGIDIKDWDMLFKDFHELLDINQ